MKLHTDVDSHLASTPTWNVAVKEARKAFRIAMRDRQYGIYECINAWEWFYTGWVMKIMNP